ncbi:MAG: peroxiredoxin family protein [Acidobacteriota bacterium]
MGGKVAPDFTLTDIDGKSFTIGKFRDHGVIHLFFTAVWCIPCRQEITKINDAYERFKAQGYTPLAIGVPTRQTPERLREYRQKEKIKFPLLFDSSGKVVESYRAEFLPRSILIDKKGTIRYEWDFVPDNFHEVINDLLKE